LDFEPSVPSSTPRLFNPFDFAQPFLYKQIGMLRSSTLKLRRAVCLRQKAIPGLTRFPAIPFDFAPDLCITTHDFS
jgi:hypothetical protein